MHLQLVDWAIIFGYLALAVGVGIYFSRKGGRSVDDYFVANRSLPWWLAGMTMVASGFAIDTPLGITGLVAGNGIQGVWFAWVFIIGAVGTLGAFVFAPLLRRSEVITIAELVELRYAGPQAAGLRLFKGVYFGLMVNAITLGSIIKAVWTVTDVVLGWNPHVTLGVVLLFTLFYSTMSGMWGIAATDVMQFCIGFLGLFVLAWFSMKHVGGADALMAGFIDRYGPEEGARRLQFFPRPGQPFFETFIVFLTLKHWTNPSPAIHQRIVSAKDERAASASTMIFCIFQFAINYWPMILIAMVSLVVFPDLAPAAAEQGYPMLIVKLIPTGLLGLLLAAMMAAFMSTVDTHLNYGASYMVKDIYQRFVNRDAEEKHYVTASRISTVIMLAIAVLVAYNLDSVQGAWYYISTLTAGYGFLMVVRWFWWRINAWCEIASLAASGISATLTAKKFAEYCGYWDWLSQYSFGWRFLFVVTVSTLAWVITANFTQPDPEEHLVRFCKKVRPYPTFWGPIYERHPEIGWNPFFARAVAHWLSGSVAVFGICFGIGNLIFGATALGLGLLLMAVVIFLVIWRTLQLGDSTPKEAEGIS
ncbi:MAG: Na+:solute symporter [Thermoanaerobaculia bacterium]|nr:Na+:solute symporter [Thermoanaerobaculia bacterium]